jgi:Asp-tRNA(Asn)/Glu-tRNA(Gln) amidotransferase A subunit family amidase
MTMLFQWEMRWPAAIYRDRGAHLIAKSVLDRLAKGEEMTIEDYRRALDLREELRKAVAVAGDVADAFVTLCSQGPAPVGMGVGNPVFADISSCTLGPAIALPLLAVEGLPLGVQLVGLPHQDHRLARRGRWLAQAVLAA